LPFGVGVGAIRRSRGRFFGLIRRRDGGAALDLTEIFLLAGGGFGAQPVERLCARGDRHQLIGAPLRQRALAGDDHRPFGLIAVDAKPLQMDSDIAVDRLASSRVPGGARQRQHRGDGDHVVAVGGVQMIVGRLGPGSGGCAAFAAICSRQRRA
jgi:hypothetical protein